MEGLLVAGKLCGKRDGPVGHWGLRLGTLQLPADGPLEHSLD